MTNEASHDDDPYVWSAITISKGSSYYVCVAQKIYSATGIHHVKGLCVWAAGCVQIIMTNGNDVGKEKRHVKFTQIFFKKLQQHALQSWWQWQRNKRDGITLFYCAVLSACLAFEILRKKNLKLLLDSGLFKNVTSSEKNT